MAMQRKRPVSQERAAIDADRPGVAGTEWDMTCAECQTTWHVTGEAILAGDDWLLCPRCRRGADGPPKPAPADG